MHILFIGYGKTSQHVAKQLFQQGHQITTVSLSRKDQAGAMHLQQDIHQLDLSTLSPIDAVYVLIAPKDPSLNGYKAAFIDAIPHMRNQLALHPIQKIIVVSSTRVYGQDQGEEIDDQTEINPKDEKALMLATMEKLWQEAFPQQCIIVRPTGIYGVSVKRMMQLAQNTMTYHNVHWSNRIHIEDLAGFLVHLLHVEHPEKTYICSNNQPIPLHEIILWFQKQLNIPPLKLLSEAQRGKKIYASRMLSTGFKLRHDQFFKDYRDLI